MSSVTVVGFPDSAGSYAAGQELAPSALRNAGLIDALIANGLTVDDAGDLPKQTWRPDTAHPFAQNAALVLTGLQALAEALHRPLADDGVVLVLGGNCTIALAVMAALQRMNEGRPGLLYIDRQFDLNTPRSTRDGALDWMGLAHGLALPGTLDELARGFGQVPLFEPEQVAWLGVDAALATAWEREQAMQLQLRVCSSDQLATDPRGSARIGLDALPSGPLAVHVDVDVLDFTDAPLAESTDGRNSGPTLDQVGEALDVVAHDPRLRVISIGELNPTRSAGDPDAIPRFVRILTATLRATATVGRARS